MDNFLRPAPDQVLQVSDLTRQIKRQLEDRFTQFWVQGEVSNVRRQSSGHVYFSLKDRNSQVPAVLFARDAARQSIQVEDGMELVLFGDLSVYEPHGRYQMIVKIAIQSGLGGLQIEFERLKRKLAAEGLFDSERKRALPCFPQRIAVVTSPSGAAVQDFIRILRRRQYRGEVVIFPARVQGKEAPAEIAAMLAHANASDGFDLVVLTRGGGSIEDLWAFNDEPLARDVAASRLPVISAVGHEIDHVLTDFAADIRSETPSGAAELISSAYLQVQERLTAAADALAESVEASVYGHQIELRDLHARLRLVDPSRHIELLSMRLDDWENKLRNALSKDLATRKDSLARLSGRLASLHPRTQLRLSEQKVIDFSRRFKKSAEVDYSRKRSQLSYLEKRLRNTNLQASLRRGFALLRKADGSIVKTIQNVDIEEPLTAQLAEGQLKLKVTEKDA